MYKRHFRLIKLAVVFSITVVASWILAHVLSPLSLIQKTALNQTQPPAEVNLASTEAVAKAIIAACPPAAPDDIKAFNACAEQLDKAEILDQTVGDQFFWGQQKSVGDYELRKNQTTLFNPFVWRRLYLSTYMFPGTYKVEQVGHRVVLHLPVQFRNQLDLGAYPYPFWHSKDKWESYQTSKELLFVMEDGKFSGALRSAERDPSRTIVTHEWNGEWTTTGQAQPTGMLYTKLLSSANPYIAELDQSFRAFESASRPFNCAACHSPDNAAKMNPLILFNYPNQALSSRYAIVSAIEKNEMPPAAIVIQGDRKTVTPQGIRNAAEKEKLLKLAKAFAEVGDLALDYEKQHQHGGKTNS